MGYVDSGEPVWDEFDRSPEPEAPVAYAEFDRDPGGLTAKKKPDHFLESAYGGGSDYQMPLCGCGDSGYKEDGMLFCSSSGDFIAVWEDNVWNPA